MRCTSSDLIIAAAVPGLTERIAPPLVRDWRVPKGQETVKVETLHRLHRAPLFQPPRERAQTDRLEGRDHGGVQERQVAEPVAQPIVAHWRRRIDVLFLRQPRKRGSLVADLVDELERDALPTGKDATVGHALQRRVVEVAACLHHAAEPGIGVRDDRLDGRARLRRGRFEAVGRRLERRGLDFFDLDAERLQKIGDVRILKQHADRADERSLQRDDVIGRDRRNVTARSRQPVDHDDQRLLLFEPHQRVVQLLGARRGAAGGIDVHDHGPRARFPQPLQRLDPLQIGADEAGDGDARDRSPRPPDQHVGAGRAQRGPYRDHRADGDDDRADAPEGELAPHAAAIDDRIGIERHGSPPLDSSGRASRAYSFFSAGFSVARLSAVPRMSPSVAPESVEPYWAIASFSSATSSALIETCTLWVRRSNWVTRASTFCPTEKRSGRCSPRSRASSERLMKVVRSLPTIFTSIPASFTSVTSQVTTEPFLRSPALSIGSPASCLMPSEMRSFSTSTSSTLALTLSPFLYSSITCSPAASSRGRTDAPCRRRRRRGQGRGRTRSCS